MPAPTTIPALRYSIIANTVENINRIRHMFDSATASPVLLGIFPSIDDFIRTTVNGNAPDFIAADQDALATHANGNRLQYPVIFVRMKEEKITTDRQDHFDVVDAGSGREQVNEVLSRLRKDINDDTSFKTVEPAALKKITRTFLTRKGREYVLLTSDSIPAFYTDNKITFAFDTTGKKFMINMTLIELENSLDPSMFFRANRQYLINRNFISRVKQLEEGRFEIVISATEPIQVEINQQKFSRLRQWIEL